MTATNVPGLFPSRLLRRACHHTHTFRHTPDRPFHLFSHPHIVSHPYRPAGSTAGRAGCFFCGVGGGNIAMLHFPEIRVLFFSCWLDYFLISCWGMCRSSVVVILHLNGALQPVNKYFRKMSGSMHLTPWHQSQFHGYNHILTLYCGCESVWLFAVNTWAVLTSVGLTWLLKRQGHRFPV